MKKPHTNWERNALSCSKYSLMNNLDYYKVVAIISPFLTAILTSTITYYFTLKGKRLDILYPNKIDEYKSIATKLVDFRVFCQGRIAYFESNEYSSVIENSFATLFHKTEIYKAAQLNTFYLCSKSKDCILDLVGKLSKLCAVEVLHEVEQLSLQIEKLYSLMLEKTDSCLNTLSKDLK